MEQTSPLRTAEEASQYAYSPLSQTDHIRLLHLHPRTRDGGISAELIETSLQDAKALGYEALSYAWGTPDFSDRLIVHGNCLPVTSNLLAALTALAKDETRTLWVDAVCIYQDDLDEKATQIPLMTEIYSFANNVLIWLGEENEVARLTFDWVPQFREEMKSLLDDEDLSLFERHERFRQSLNVRNECTGVSDLFERDWFHRLWVVQEIVVAKSATFVCGPLTMPYEVLADFAFLLNSGRITHHCVQSRRSRLGHGELLSLHAIRDSVYRERHLTLSHQMDLIDLMTTSRLRQCFDPRDRLYALAGLATDPNKLPYLPSYQKDTSKVYTDFAIHHIIQSSHLRILAFAYLAPLRTDNLPSWVPDWTQCCANNFSEPPGPGYPRLYFASGKSSGQYQSLVVQPNMQPPALILTGVLVDRVSVLWLIPQKPGSSLSTDSDVEYGYVLEQLLLFCGPFSDHRIPWQVLWRVLVSDKSLCHNYKSRATDDDQRHVEVAMNGLIYDWQQDQFKDAREQARRNEGGAPNMVEPRYGEALEAFQIRWEIAPLPKNRVAGFLKLQAIKAGMKWENIRARGRRQGLLRERKPIEPDPGSTVDSMYISLDNFARTIAAIFADRSFCISESGRCGWIPDVSTAGDVVAIFAGHDVPMILRPCDNGSYKVVGESYIHGLMDGEGVPDPTAFRQFRLI